MDGVILAFSTMGIGLLTIVLTIIFVAIGVVILMTIWALIKPHISWAIDKWWNWFYKRVG